MQFPFIFDLEINIRKTRRTHPYKKKIKINNILKKNRNDKICSYLVRLSKNGDANLLIT